MLALIDYGAGNLGSVGNALDFLGVSYVVTADPAAIARADRLLLPGVGAFPDAMRMLRAAGLLEVLRAEAAPGAGPAKPFLGVCLGMQMLFDTSDEFEETAGLGWIPGRVGKIEFPDEAGFSSGEAGGRFPRLKIPHVGFNALEFHQPCPLLAGVEEGACVYFVHSYRAYTGERWVAAYTDYGGKIPALVQRGNLFGAQFHPEKSGEAGLRILKNFANL